jgi:hypothetical protein
MDVKVKEIRLPTFCVLILSAVILKGILFVKYFLQFVKYVCLNVKYTLHSLKN